MKAEQEAIYFLAGDDADALRQVAAARGFPGARASRCCCSTDPVDAFWPDRLGSWEGKPIRSVTQGAADLSKLAPEAAGAARRRTCEKLIPALKAALGEAVAEVRATDRLVDSAVVLAAAAGSGRTCRCSGCCAAHGKRRHRACRRCSSSIRATR